MPDHRRSIEDRKRQSITNRKANSLSTALTKVSAILVTVAAALSLNVSPASAATVTWCHDPNLGGTFICFNHIPRTGEAWQYYPNGTEQVFVNGVKYELWTRWTNTNGTWSGWTSMGGKIAWYTTPGVCAHLEYTWVPVVAVYNPDGNTSCRGRYTSGGWRRWSHCIIPKNFADC
jgi:hypothetical protein